MIPWWESFICSLTSRFYLKTYSHLAQKVGKVLNISKSCTMSIVSKWKTHGTIQTLLRSGCATKLSYKATRAIVSACDQKTSYNTDRVIWLKWTELLLSKHQCLKHFLDSTSLGELRNSFLRMEFVKGTWPNPNHFVLFLKIDKNCTHLPNNKVLWLAQTNNSPTPR